MRPLIAVILLCLGSPALASTCLDAGVIEMAAAVGGTGSWQAVVDAHRAALAAGCDDPVIGLNIARAQRRMAQEDDTPEPTCDAVDAYRVVLARGEPGELMPLARARMDELSALCAARRARAAALAATSTSITSDASFPSRSTPAPTSTAAKTTAGSTPTPTSSTGIRDASGPRR